MENQNNNQKKGLQFLECKRATTSFCQSIGAGVRMRSTSRS